MNLDENNKKVIYYSDPLNDDFAGTNINTKKINKNYKYIHKNIVWIFFSKLVYFLAWPIIYLITVVILGIKFQNKKALKKIKGNCFLYGNHTAYFDAYIPAILSGHKMNKIITSPDAVSIKGIKTIVEWLGAIPVANDIATTKNFMKAIEFYNHKGNNITIYPEAHIWPYYTGVRPFKDSSFYYPTKQNSPAVAFFTAYSKPTGIFKKLKKANITVYVSEPFYPDLTKPAKIAQKELRDKVYNFMCEMSEKYSDYKVIEYIYKDKEKTE